MSTIHDLQKALIEEFRLLEGDQKGKIEYIMELGSMLPHLTSEERTASNLVKGCLTNVWLVKNCQDDLLFLKGDSDASFTKGLLAILIRLFSAQSVQDIAQHQWFLPTAINLDNFVSLQRLAGIQAIWKQIQQTAQTIWTISEKAKKQPDTCLSQ